MCPMSYDMRDGVSPKPQKMKLTCRKSPESGRESEKGGGVRQGEERKRKGFSLSTVTARVRFDWPHSHKHAGPRLQKEPR